MLRWIAGRVAQAALTLLVVVAAAFLLLESLPGDPLPRGDDPSLTLADRQRLEAVYALDRPPAERFLTFVSHALRGDFGISLSRHRPVLEVLLTALGPTLLLTGTALAIAFTLGLTLGTRAALHPRGPSGMVVHRLLPALDALPPFWLGLLAIWLFAWKLDWLPASHMRRAGAQGFDLPDLLRHLLLPALVIGVPSAAAVARHHATRLAESLAGAAALAGRAMGLPRRVLLRRALRESAQPVVALAGLALPVTVGGAVVVEVVFSWPGLGRVHHQALEARDLPLVLGGLILVGAAVLVGGILTDLLGAWLDPRQRLGSEEAR
ncbi:MAG: ABC transporter permease [Acidobacteriota bacterium]|nr:ABC transporter permease [Acidobacteriota bacterium]